MPSGSTITLVNLTQDLRSIGEDAFRVMPGKGAIYNSSDPSRLYVANLDIFGVPETNANTVASECALWFCVQTFNTTVTGSNQQQNVLESFSTIVSREEGGATTFAELPPSMLPPSMQSRVPTIYEVETYAAGALSTYLSKALNGTAKLDTESIEYSSDIMQAICDASADLNGWIDNVAASMSQVVRTTAPQSDSAYDGTASILIYEYRVRWGWIAMPVILVASSLVLLVVAIARTNRHAVCAWKGSPLALLYMKLDPTIRSHAADRFDAYHGLQDSIGKIGVYLERDQVWQSRV